MTKTPQPYPDLQRDKAPKATKIGLMSRGLKLFLYSVYPLMCQWRYTLGFSNRLNFGEYRNKIMNHPIEQKNSEYESKKKSTG